MYVGHVRLCLCVCLSHFLYYICCGLVAIFFSHKNLTRSSNIGAKCNGERKKLRFSTNILETRNVWQILAVACHAHRTPHALRMPVKTPLASDKIDAPAACATLSATRPFHFVHTAGVLWVHSAFFVPSDLDLWPLTLTFKVVRAKDQTRLRCEFGANPFSGSCHPLSNTSPKNRTRFDDFAHLSQNGRQTIVYQSSPNFYTM